MIQKDMSSPTILMICISTLLVRYKQKRLRIPYKQREYGVFLLYELNDIAASVKTHNGHINGRVLERSVANAMREAMDDIKVSER